MSTLEPRIEAVRVKYGLDVSDFWQIKQNKQWVCRHAALEIVAVKAGIEWLPPMILEKDAPNLVTSMVVTGKMGDRVEWATGETNPTNYSVSGKQPAYPWAMSEKRAKDRVVLKLVGIHGLVYSEDEMPTVPEQPEKQEAKTTSAPKNDEARQAYKYLQDDMRKINNVGDLRRWFVDSDVVELRRKIPADWDAELKREWIVLGKELANKSPEKQIADAVGGIIVDERYHSNLDAGE